MKLSSETSITVGAFIATCVLSAHPAAAADRLNLNDYDIVMTEITASGHVAYVFDPETRTCYDDPAKLAAALIGRGYTPDQLIPEPQVFDPVTGVTSDGFFAIDGNDHGEVWAMADPSRACLIGYIEILDPAI